MASKKAIYDHLKQVSLFSSCSNKDLEKIAKAGDQILMPAGQVIIEQGQSGHEAFVILSGSATVKRNGKKVATLGVGSMVGELSLLDHGPRTATVTCETDSELLVIAQRHFLAIIDEVPALGHKLLANLAGKIREFDRQYYG
jgi:CRP/FNR family cyclic AMP-dependent transcriptional regulator